MQLDQLRYFVAVAEELSFRKAASRLHISQPPISYHIKALEQELGIRLLNRSTREVSLTEAGSHFLEKAQRILSLVNATADEMRDIAVGKVGMLRIGFTTATSLEPFFYHAIHSYRSAHPRVTMRFSDMSSGKQIQALSEGELDVGFLRWAFSPSAGLATAPLNQGALVLAIHSSHPLKSLKRVPLSKLRNEPFISYPSNAGAGVYHQILHMCVQAGFVPKIIQEAFEPSLIIGLVAAGLGVAIVPPSLQCIHIPGVLFKRIADKSAATRLNLVHRLDDANPHLKTFKDVVLGICAQETV